jgi:hypothetical protein
VALAEYNAEYRHVSSLVPVLNDHYKHTVKVKGWRVKFSGRAFVLVEG